MEKIKKIIESNKPLKNKEAIWLDITSETPTLKIFTKNGKWQAIGVTKITYTSEAWNALSEDERDQKLAEAGDALVIITD